MEPKINYEKHSFIESSTLMTIFPRKVQIRFPWTCQVNNDDAKSCSLVIKTRYEAIGENDIVLSTMSILSLFELSNVTSYSEAYKTMEQIIYKSYNFLTIHFEAKYKHTPFYEFDLPTNLEISTTIADILTTFQGWSD